VDLGTYKGCNATDADFSTTTVWQGPKPSSGGDNGATKTVDALGTLKANRYVYVNYNFIEPGDTCSSRISRFTLGAGTTGKIDMASEKVLIRIPCQNNDWHTAGAMKFDAYGDLWLAIGDNQQTENTAGNSADLRGGILRIHPDNSALGYSIPKGNYGEVFSAYFKGQGNDALAAQYADTSRVKAEIYVKGTRNAYTLTLDPVRRWMTWGDVGPDQGKVSEEYNLVKVPVQGGWPYYAGSENMGAGSPSGGPANGPYGTPLPVQGSPDAMVNNYPGIKGVRNLPPNRNPIFAKNESCAMSGPIFLYDGSNPSPTQFPPQMNRKWIVSDCNGAGYGYRLLNLDATGDAVTGGDALRIFQGANAPRTVELVDMEQGPDGALYVVDWGAGAIFRIDYKGACKDPDFVSVSKPALSRDPILVKGRSITVSLDGGYEIRLLDVAGRVAYARSGAGDQTYLLPAFKGTGVYQLEVKGSEGVFTRRLLSMTP